MDPNGLLYLLYTSYSDTIFSEFPCGSEYPFYCLCVWNLAGHTIHVMHFLFFQNFVDYFFL